MSEEFRRDTPIKNALVTIGVIIGVAVIGWRILQMAHFVSEDAAPAVGRAAEAVWDASDPTP